jgi:hypothetical protein
MQNVIERLNDVGVQARVTRAARAAVLEQLKKEGIELSPEVLAELAARTATSRDPADTLAAGAVFIATVALFSDERLKSNIKYLNSTDSGFGIYEFSYKGFQSRWRGVLAQEVEKTHPHAVTKHDSGYLMVDYGLIGIQFCSV